MTRHYYDAESLTRLVDGESDDSPAYDGDDGLVEFDVVDDPYDEPFQINDEVVHKEYGEGTIIKPAGESSRLYVDFDQGGLRNVRESRLTHGENYNKTPDKAGVSLGDSVYHDDYDTGTVKSTKRAPTFGVEFDRCGFHLVHRDSFEVLSDEIDDTNSVDHDSGDTIIHETHGRGVIIDPNLSPNTFKARFIGNNGTEIIHNDDIVCHDPVMDEPRELGHITIRDDQINEPIEEVRLDIAGSGAKMNVVTADAEPGTYKLVKEDINE